MRRTACLVEPAARKRNLTAGRSGDDRVEVLHLDDGRLLGLVADGATGTGEGWKASGILASHFLQTAVHDVTPAGLSALLSRADAMIHAELRGWADTTGIVLSLSGASLTGASAGDSQAFVLGRDWREVTEAQSRKPRLGAGASIRTFGTVLSEGEILLAATDGLWNWVGRRAIEQVLRNVPDPATVVRKLRDAVCSNNDGHLPDDLGILVIRAPAQTVGLNGPETMSPASSCHAEAPLL